MTGHPHRPWFVRLALMTLCLPLTAGCSGTTSSTVVTATTTRSTLDISEKEPVVLTKALAEKMKPDMSFEQVLEVLKNATQDQPSVKHRVDGLFPKEKITKRYELTLKQGQRKLLLIFVENKLREKNPEYLE